jgi:hypothetical protein
MYRDYSGTIRPNTDILEGLKKIEDDVYEQVKISCPGSWSAISYAMRGPSPTPSWEPLEPNSKPTIMVGIAPGEMRNWDLVAEQIMGVPEKAELGFPVWVELLPAARAER